MSENPVYTFFNKTDNYLHRRFGVRLRSEIVASLIHPVDLDLIDVGCGDGGVTMQFVPFNRVSFVDISENMLNLVKKDIPTSIARNATFIQSSIDDLRTEARYDFVFAIGVLAHVPSAVGALEKMMSLLKDNGRLVIQFSNADALLTKLRIRLGNKTYAVNQLHYREMKRLAEELRLSIEREVRYSYILPGMGRLPDPFLYRYSKFIWKSKLASVVGTDFIWILKRK